MIHSLRLSRRLVERLSVASAIAVVGLVVGWVPTFHRSSTHFTVEFSASAQAQAIANIDNEEVESYARSVLAIEPIRQAAYDEIKRILGSGQVPPIACHRPNSLNTLNPNIRQIARNYCNRAIQIVERNDLTINRFNTITVAVQSNSDLASVIQREIMRLQRNP